MEPEKHLVHVLLLRDPVILQLEEIVVLPEERPIIERRLFRALVVARRDVPRHLAREAGGERDDSLVVPLKNLPVDARLVIEALRKARRDDLHEILIAEIVFREENQMEIAVVGDISAFLKAAARRNIDLAAEDRFDPLREGLFIEIDASEHHAVIGNRRSGLPELTDAGHILFYFVGAVEE